MVEITAEEQNKVKIIKGTEDSIRDLWDDIKYTNIWFIGGPRRRREKERIWENFWGDYSRKLPQHGKGNSQSSPRSAESPIQDKSKKKHAETQLTKIKHKERILKPAREKQQVTYKGNAIWSTADLSAETLQAGK